MHPLQVSCDANKDIPKPVSHILLSLGEALHIRCRVHNAVLHTIWHGHDEESYATKNMWVVVSCTLIDVQSTSIGDQACSCPKCVPLVLLLHICQVKEKFTWVAEDR